MKPIIDLNKEYGLVFDGGGARGAYQIGAWRALSEAGVKISAVAGYICGRPEWQPLFVWEIWRKQDISGKRWHFPVLWMWMMS